ncbi:hypothetical protein BMR1_01G01856 [Babesia microti strain RI]|uniref:Uncharacterized protein n=1 Tax=Babesia microti (strain RI) TaxID=1133968 RepID=A0A1N6LWT2_BABMR|nr:hypothetical protein BMR1_01G01856 [Babesia microti strain RI]SIO73326.1 hypothetical protein BMR1_01G01856 [Babesia microti strain RI]|eukprot:XP_021337428.1 hypothetical protein BMR1_01G01856 [Babesia microti strain RI]
MLIHSLRLLVLVFVVIKFGWTRCEDYLVIPNTQKFCKGDRILSASENRGETEARKACDRLCDCNLISASFGSDASDSSVDYHFSWLCSEDFTNLEHSIGWTTLVKADLLRKHAGGLNLLLNITTDCDIADETPIYDAGVLANVAKECSSDPDCYLLLSNTASIKRCRGKLGKNVTPSPGNFVLYKNAPNEWPIREAYSYTRVPYSHSYLHGPLTPDHFFNNLSQGTLVRARRIGSRQGSDSSANHA